MTVASGITEDALIETLSQVLLHHGEEIEGLDEDLVAYMAGMLASRAAEAAGGGEDPNDIIEEVLTPFLESVSCPEELSDKAQQAVLHLMEEQSGGDGSAVSSSGAEGTGTTRKLRGMVSMSSTLDNQTEAEVESNKYLWGTEGGVKAMANDLIDAHQDKTSAKEKRKARKLEAERARKMLASSQDRDVDTEAGGGLVRMNYKFVASTALAMASEQQDKKKDVLVRNVTVSLDNGTTLLEHGELKFAYQRRYGLIGENGVGKTTLLKAISRQDDILDGFPSHLRVLHVRQEVPSHFENDLTVTEAVLQSDVERMELLKLEKEIIARLEGDGSSTDGKSKSIQEKRQKLSQKVSGGAAGGGTAADPALQEMQKDLKQLDQIYARLQLLNSDSAEARAAMILTGLQFSLEMQHRALNALSGGWKMRVALASALFIEPDLLLLDEPTNHLDLEAVLWLESYLCQYSNTLVVVSHDRGFLNEVCTDIIEFKKKKLTYYRGNFDTYVKLRDENIRNAMRVYEAYKAKRDHMMDFINKFRANAKRATMVQSRIKAVEKMDAEAPEPIEVDPVWRFSIPNSEPLGPPIISINDVSFDYNPMRPDGTKKTEDEYLLQKVNFGVDLQSKIAILGKNGQGKTTLLNLIMGKIKPISGSVSIHGNLRIGHFTQHSSDNFDLKLSALENLLNMFESAEDQEMRSFLGRFQIQGNDALKPMMLLSGGQKSRVSFAALAYRKPHVLVIDEGSNHLSMEAVDALVEAIQDFKGGILVVSHDEYFVSKTCDELWVVNDGKANRFRGDFEEYKKHTAEETQKRVEESVKRLHAANG